MALTNRSLPLRPVPRETVQDHVYRQLKELILNGGIEPGRTVTIQSLADAFGVSAMPVREALHRLVAEKALTVVAGRSVGIPPLNIDRLEDLTRARIEIELELAGSELAEIEDLRDQAQEPGRVHPDVLDE